MIMNDYDENEHKPISLEQLALHEKEMVNIAASLTSLNIIPFDVSNVISKSNEIYGYLGTGNLIVSTVKIKNVDPIEENGKVTDLNNELGIVIGHLHGRIVIALTSSITNSGIEMNGEILGIPEYYYGWLVPGQFEIVSFFDNKLTVTNPLYLN